MTIPNKILVNMYTRPLWSVEFAENVITFAWNQSVGIQFLSYLKLVCWLQTTHGFSLDQD